MIQSFKLKYRSIVQKIKLGRPNKSELELIKWLRREMGQLSNSMASSTDFWSQKRKELFEQISKNDPRNFTRWEVMYPMFFLPDDAEFHKLRNSKNWELFSQALTEDKIGNPQPYKLYRKSSGNLVHHLYSLNEFLERSRKEIADMKTIFEFGGGYGSLCRLCYRLGFKGSYIIFDLPEYSVLQSYFLRSLPLNLDVHMNEIKTGKNSVSLISRKEDLKDLVPVDLWIGLWSISETPVDLRNMIFPLTRSAKSYLIAYQDDFRGLKNNDYFKRFAQTGFSGQCVQYPIPHMKGNNYLFIYDAKPAQ